MTVGLDQFGEVIDAFLSRPDLAALSRRTYAEVLDRLVDELNQPAGGGGRVSGWPTDLELEAAVTRLWGARSPATWNRNITVVRSLCSWATRHRLVEAAPALTLERRRESVDRTRAIPPARLERFLSRDGLPVRDRCLYRLLYETAARAREILGLDVEDLDLGNHRGRIRSKGGDVDLVHFQSGAARLLPRIVAGRRCGPVFLTDRVAPAGTPALDVCPSTGRARLSYRRAAAVFAEHTDGWTLHQLRHSAITHLAEAGEPTVLLMAKSRHRSLRTLQRYARPGPEAVAAMTARHDPARRR